MSTPKYRGPYHQVIRRWIFICCYHNNRLSLFDKIQIAWNECMTSTAGMAYLPEKILKFSPKQWKRFSTKERKQLVFHETCHLMCPGDENHGKLWKQKMANCGYANATRFIE